MTRDQESSHQLRLKVVPCTWAPGQEGKGVLLACALLLEEGKACSVPSASPGGDRGALVFKKVLQPVVYNIVGTWGFIPEALLSDRCTRYPFPAGHRPQKRGHHRAFGFSAAPSTWRPFQAWLGYPDIAPGLAPSLHHHHHGGWARDGRGILYGHEWDEVMSQGAGPSCWERRREKRSTGSGWWWCVCVCVGGVSSSPPATFLTPHFLTTGFLDWLKTLENTLYH